MPVQQEGRTTAGRGSIRRPGRAGPFIHPFKRLIERVRVRPLKALLPGFDPGHGQCFSMRATAPPGRPAERKKYDAGILGDIQGILSDYLRPLHENENSALKSSLKIV